jgi:hypothetical protein
MFGASEIEGLLKEVRSELQTLPGVFDQRKVEGETQIEHLITQAGIAQEIASIRASIEKSRTEIQRHADRLSGKLQLLEQMLDKARAYVPPGTMVHGIDVSKLDSTTRLLVMSGNLQTIAALGGKLESAAQPEDASELHLP